MLLREVNHRVGNSLQIIASLLHLQANSATQDDVKAALTNAMGRVAAVAQVHRRLYTSHDLKSVLLNQYLEALLEDLRRSAEGNRMSRLTLKAEPIEIDPDRAVAIGIIVNELVMNAVKYAYPDGAGPIHVELKATGDDVAAVDRRRRRRPQRQGRPALHRHGTAHRLGDGVETRSRRRARSRPCRDPDRAALPPRQQAGAEAERCGREDRRCKIVREAPDRRPQSACSCDEAGCAICSDDQDESRPMQSQVPTPNGRSSHRYCRELRAERMAAPAR